VLAHPVLGLAQRSATALAQRRCMPLLLASQSYVTSNQECISAQRTIRQMCRTSQRSRQLSSRLPSANGVMSG